MRPVLLFCFLSLVWGSATYAQTTTIFSGNWSDGTIWSGGSVPGNATTGVLVVHPLRLDNSITISDGTYTFSKNVTDLPSLMGNTLSIGRAGELDVTAGTTTFIGGGNIDGRIYVRNGATLILGSTTIQNGARILIESGGTLRVNGNLTNLNNQGTFTVNGLVYVTGNFTNGNGNRTVDGTGEVYSGGSMTNGGSSEIFGSEESCNTGPCSGRNLCGFTNSISASQYQCQGTTPARLTGTTNASNPTYLWEFSTTSSTTGFSEAPNILPDNPNNGTSYSPTSVSQTTWFRRKVTSGGCTGTSSAIQITYLPANGGWRGNFGTNWNTGSNWCNNNAPNSSADIVIPPTVSNNNWPHITNPSVSIRSLTVHEGAQLIIDGGRTLSVYGDITNSGTISATNGTLALVGASPQTVRSRPLTLNNLVFNNSSGIVFDAMTTVTNQITMTAGAVDLSLNGLLLTNSSDAALNYTNGRLINGAFTRTIPATTFTDRLFPMGTEENNRPLMLDRTVAGTSEGTLRVTHTGSTVTTEVSVPDADAIIVRRQESSWTIINTNASGGEFNLKAGGTGFGTVNMLSDLRVMRNDDVVGMAGHVTGTVSPNENFLVSRTGLSASDLTNTFYIGSVDALQTPLPIRLLSFSGYFSGNGTTLDWSTASEDNFDHFLLERSSNGVDFESIARISGKGGHNIISKYSHPDKTAHSGRYYYRLKIINLDESFEYSKTIAIIASGEKNGVSVYPNPASNQSFHVKLNEDVSSARLVLLDELGKIHLDVNLSEGDNEIPLRLDMPNGIYVVRVLTGSGIQTMKLVVAR